MSQTTKTPNKRIVVSEQDVKHPAIETGHIRKTAGLSLKLRPAVLVFYASMNESKRFRVESRLVPRALPSLRGTFNAYFSGAIRPA